MWLIGALIIYLTLMTPFVLKSEGAQMSENANTVFIGLCWRLNGVSTLPDAEIDTETDKIWSCIELYEGVHTGQRQTSIQIPIEFYLNLSIFVSVSVSGNVNASVHHFII